MQTLNSNFYQPNTTVSRKQAEERLINLGYKNFEFNSASYTNGASFYFTSENGEKLRVSDHPLTVNRAFSTVQISLTEVKKFSAKTYGKQNSMSDLEKRIQDAIKRKNKL